MRLRALRLLRAPGLSGELRLDELDAPLELVVGPNASGKTTLCRVVRATLWPRRADRGLRAESDWELDDGTRLEATLAHGRAEWVRDGSPVDPPPLPRADHAGAYALSLRALLDADAETDARIARAFEVQLAGGYDLDRARETFDASPGPGRKLPRQLEHARRRVSEVERRFGELADRERELDEARRELATARQAVAERERLEAARRAVAQRAEGERLTRELEGFPEAVAELRGDELEQLDRLDRDLAELDAQRRDKVGARDEAKRRIREAALPEEAAIPEEDLAARRSRVTELRERAHQLEGAERDVERLTARARELRGRLVPEEAAGRSARLDDASLERIQETLRERTELEGRLAGLRQREELLAERAPSEEAPPVEDLREAVRDLRAWVATPEPADAGASSGRVWLGAALLALVAVVLGVLLDLPRVVALLLVALGAAVAGAAAARTASGRSRPDRRHAEERRTRRRSFERAGLPGPASWTHGAVEGRLNELERRLVAAETAARAAEELEELRRERAGLEERLEELRAEHAGRLRELGLRDDVGELALDGLSRRIRELDEAEGELSDREQLRRELAERVDAELRALSDFSEAHGGPRCPDVAAAEAALDGLARRSRETAEARRALEAAERELDQLDERLADKRAERAGLFERAGVAPEDRRALEDRVEAAGRYRELARALDEARRTLDGLRASVEDASLLDLDADELARRRDEADELARSEGDLRERVGALQQELEQAAGGTTLEEATAERDRAHEAMARQLERAVEDELGRMLLDEVRAEHERDHAPDVVRRARGWFAHVTRHAFELEAGAADEGRLLARDASRDELRGLAELSDATRIQLLLAARLAWFEHVEAGGERLPLLLDEALSTTDAARFEAVAGALADLADAGRQVVYLTASRADVAAWRHFLEQERGMPTPGIVELPHPSTGASAQAPGELPSPSAPEPVPAPDGHTAASYAEALGVPHPVPHEPATSWHLWFLLHDDLEALHACVARGVDTVGRWRAGRRAPTDPTPLDAEAAARVDERTSLLQRAVEAWHHGRGRPVGVEVLEASGAISERFHEQAVAVLERVGGDPEALVEGVRAIPYFRSDKADELRDHLLEAGHLDEATPPRPDEAVERAVDTALEQGELGRHVTPRDARALARWLVEALERARGA